MRVLPPPGTLIWRFPGFIRPRCTAGATHHESESYVWFEGHHQPVQLLSIDTHILTVKITYCHSERSEGSGVQAGVVLSEIEGRSPPAKSRAQRGNCLF